jgi:hypothetical protein
MHPALMRRTPDVSFKFLGRMMRTQMRTLRLPSTITTYVPSGAGRALFTPKPLLRLEALTVAWIREVIPS